MKSREEMREWLEFEKKRLREFIRDTYTEEGRAGLRNKVKIIDAILAVLAERTDGPSEEERKEMLRYFEGLMQHRRITYGPNLCRSKVFYQIHALILGSRGGAVSPDTQVSPHGETSGAVTDKWERDRLWCSALVHVLSVEDVAKVTGYFNSIRPDPEAGVAVREGK